MNTRRTTRTDPNQNKGYNNQRSTHRKESNSRYVPVQRSIVPTTSDRAPSHSASEGYHATTPVPREYGMLDTIPPGGFPQERSRSVNRVGKHHSPSPHTSRRQSRSQHEEMITTGVRN